MPSFQKSILEPVLAINSAAPRLRLRKQTKKVLHDWNLPNSKNSGIVQRLTPVNNIIMAWNDLAHKLLFCDDGSINWMKQEMYHIKELRESGNHFLPSLCLRDCRISFLNSYSLLFSDLQNGEQLPLILVMQWNRNRPKFKFSSTHFDEGDRKLKRPT